MLLGGDELSHTRKGITTYCQGRLTAALDFDERQQQFQAFVKKSSASVTSRYSARQFFKGRAIRGTDIKDISFLNPRARRDDRRSGMPAPPSAWVFAWRAI